MDTYLNKLASVIVKKAVSVIVIVFFVFSMLPVSSALALRNPQPANAVGVGSAIGEAIAKSTGNLTEEDGALMISNWENLSLKDRQSVLTHLTAWQQETVIDVRVFYQNIVNPPTVTAVEPTGNIMPVEGVDLTLASPSLSEYIAIGKEQVKKGKVRGTIAVGGPGARLLLKDESFPQDIKDVLIRKGLLSKPTIPAGPVSGKGCVTFILENVTKIEEERNATVSLVAVETPETKEQLQRELVVNGQMVNLRDLRYSEALVRPVLDENNKIPVTWDDKGNCIPVLQPGGTLDAFKPNAEIADSIQNDDTVLVLYGDDPILNDADFIYSVAGAREKENADVLVVATPKTSLVWPFGGTVLEAGGRIMIVEVNNRRDVNEQGPYADASKRKELTDKWAQEHTLADDEARHKKSDKGLGEDPNNPNPIKGLDLIEANILAQGEHLSFNTGVLVFSGRAAKALVALMDKFPSRIATNRQVTVRGSADPEAADTKINIKKSEEYLTDALGLLQDQELLREIDIETPMIIRVAEVDAERYGATKTWGKVESARQTIASMGRKKAEELGISVSGDSVVEIGPSFTGTVGQGVTITNGGRVYLNGEANIGDNVMFEGPGIVHVVGDVTVGDGVLFVPKDAMIRVVAPPKEGQSITIANGCLLESLRTPGKKNILNIIKNIPPQAIITLTQTQGYADILDADDKNMGLLPFGAGAANAGAVESGVSAKASGGILVTVPYRIRSVNLEFANTTRATWYFTTDMSTADQIIDRLDVDDVLEVVLPDGRHVAVMGSHGYACAFLWKMYREGVIGKNEALLHIDHHADIGRTDPESRAADLFLNGKATFEMVYQHIVEGSRNAWDNDFTSPLMVYGIVDPYKFLFMNNFSGKAMRRDFDKHTFSTNVDVEEVFTDGLLDIDMGVFNWKEPIMEGLGSAGDAGWAGFRDEYLAPPGEIPQGELNYVAKKLAPHAKVVTIALSPGYTDVGDARSRAKALLRMLAVVPIKGPSEVGTGGAQVTTTTGAVQRVTEVTAVELTEIKAGLITKLTPELPTKPYAVLLHPEPAGNDAMLIRSRMIELGIEPNNVIIFATEADAQQFIEEHADEILFVVNRLPGANLITIAAGLPVQDISANVASVVPDTAKDLEIWL